MLILRRGEAGLSGANRCRSEPCQLQRQGRDAGAWPLQRGEPSAVAGAWA